jgi:hypothetical protein
LAAESGALSMRFIKEGSMMATYSRYLHVFNQQGLAISGPEPIGSLEVIAPVAWAQDHL